MSFKICPSCGQRRPEDEVFCRAVVDGFECRWDLTSVSVQIDHPAPSPPVEAEALTCTNGHPVRPGDTMCGECGADVGSDAQPSISPPPYGFRDGEDGQPSFDGAPGAQTEPTPSDLPQQRVQVPLEQTLARIGNWSLERRTSRSELATKTWQARGSEATGQAAAAPAARLVLYPQNVRIDPAVSEAAAALAPRILTPLAVGTHDGQVFEVYAPGALLPLSEIDPAEATPERIRPFLKAASSLIADIGRSGFRHRDLTPDAILVGGECWENLAICRLGAARLAAHDLDAAAPPELTRYAAPETLTGAVTPASDWWSLGIVILELATRGACFDGIGDQAFLMQVVAGGVVIPEDLDKDLTSLLRGLLATDRTERWQGTEVAAWLEGEPVSIPHSSPSLGAKEQDEESEALTLGGKAYKRVNTYALGAGRAENWEEAKSQLVGGRLIGWLEGQTASERVCAQLRNILRRDDLDDDWKLSVALRHLNRDMPLVRAGEIVTAAWLLAHIEDAHALISGPAPDLLRQIDAEPRLIELKRRFTEVRRRAKQLEIALDEASLRHVVLAPSRRALAAEWDDRRRLLPDSDHKGLAGLMDRSQLRDEDLILLLAAETNQFKPLSEIVEEATRLAERERIASFDAEVARGLLVLPRRVIVERLEHLTEGFARSDHERIDAWVDQFRLERRIPVARAAVICSVPASGWRKPPRQDYIARLLEHFETRIGTSVSRGALARMTISRSSPRVDLTELGTRRVRATALLDHLLERTDSAIDVDVAAFDADRQIEQRLRSLFRRADLHRRETGINGLYLGFPFVLARPRGSEAKTRIAPVFLWPIAIQTEVGQRARFRLAFDRDREKVRLNPALKGMLAADALARWEEALDNILGGVATLPTVLDELTGLVDQVRDKTIAKLPANDVAVVKDRLELSAAAVLFHVTFVGQEIVSDIHQLQSVPPTGTGLEMLLRSSDGPPPRLEAGMHQPEIDRFATADSDPTQDHAVARARSGPGLVIEGPPGTGKSQTIVNLVADAIGNKRSLLIVCQKQAALDVVQKRLEREGLKSRIVMVKDLTKDRRPILEDIRDQLQMLASANRSDRSWQRRRKAVIDRIRRFEDQLNASHGALRRRDDVSGRTYREVLSDLIEIDDEAKSPDAVALRPLLAETSAEVVDTLAEQCGAVGPLWLKADYEASPLHDLKPFGTDSGTLAQCLAAIEVFADAEHKRESVIAERGSTVPVTNAADLGLWAVTNAKLLVDLDQVGCKEVQWLVDAFEPRANSKPRATVALPLLEQVRTEINDVVVPRFDSRLGKLVESLGDLEIDGWINVVADALTQRGFLARLFGGGKAARRKVEAVLVGVTPAVSDAIMQSFLEALDHDKKLRALRHRLDGAMAALTGTAFRGARGNTAALAEEVDAVLAAVSRVAPVHAILAKAPCRAEAMAAARLGRPSAFVALIQAINRGLTCHSVRSASLRSLDGLSPWLESRWILARRAEIQDDRSSRQAVSRLQGSIANVEPFQKFRARAAQLPDQAIELFAALRPLAGQFAERTGEVGRVIKREARLAWKQRLEAAEPMLLADQREIAAIVRSLDEAEHELAEVNGEALAANIDIRRIGNRNDWQNITRFTGPQARRLREFLQIGSEIGLMELRPVWLMSPDVASRLLPLTSGLFDQIIYDEASQMPVEYALPTLFRARSVIVSGDEKQLPPTSFFASRSTDSEGDDGDLDVLGDDADESELAAATDNWNRREIQNCPNLLELSKVVLPSVQLQVHYRSHSRELITYSNEAFYGGSLSIPVRHPEAEIDRIKPIEVIHVGGLYTERTNEAEARQLIARLEEMWLASAEPPTAGVVTFNSNQADLIEELLEERAEESAAFASAYRREATRIVGGEDVGFFVKNVENVQGDERDHILFSTTFGRNEQGTFRRNFGVLGQNGGERRLNVAVTRAKRRITIFTSMPIPEIAGAIEHGGRPSTPRDHLQLYLAYADALSRSDHVRAQHIVTQLGSVRAEGRRGRSAVGALDGFERSVARAVKNLGWEPLSARDGGAFGIDLAIPDPARGSFAIGIECDTSDHPLLARGHAREVWRRTVMSRSIPHIHRVGSRDWYQDRQGELARLKRAIVTAMSSERGRALQAGDDEPASERKLA